MCLGIPAQIVSVEEDGLATAEVSGVRREVSTALVPEAKEELQVMMQAFILDKSIFELGYELNNRPTWLRIPLQGVLHLMETEPKK